LRERVQLGDGLLLEFGDIHGLEPSVQMDAITRPAGIRLLEVH
jgi:hypothetical protein